MKPGTVAVVARPEGGGIEQMLCLPCFNKGGFAIATSPREDFEWTQAELDEAANDPDVGETKCDVCNAVLATPLPETAEDHALL